MTLSRLHITMILGLAVIVWGLVLGIQGTAVTRAHLAPFSIVVGFLVLLATAFEHRLWRLRWIHGWIVKRPDLRGTWQIELISDSLYATDPIVCYMGVKQTLSTLQIPDDARIRVLARR